MKKATILLLLLSLVLTSAAFAGNKAAERAQALKQAMASYNKAIGPDEVQQVAVPMRRSSGPLKKYITEAGILSQVDVPEHNEQIWGVYGPSWNIARDFDAGRIDAGWSNTYVTAPPPGGSRLIANANSFDNGETWTIARALDDQSAVGRSYYGVINHAYSATAGEKTTWIAYVEREPQRVDILQDVLPGFQLFDRETILDVSDATVNDLVFTFMVSADNASGSSNIYVTEYQTGGADSTIQDNIWFMRTTDGGATWEDPTLIFGDGAGQVPLEYSVNNGNYCALAMAVDPNDENHIGGVFITNYIPDYDEASNDTLFHFAGGKGDSDYQYFFIESSDAGDTWSTPEMILGRDPLGRTAFEYTFEWDSTGDGSINVTNSAYPWGGGFFWSFLYEPMYTADGTFHITIMPTLFEDPDGEQVGIGTSYNTAIYAQRTSDGTWSYVHDFGFDGAATTRTFNVNSDFADARFGQVWYAQVHKAYDNDDIIAVSWSSRIQAYNTPPYPNSDPKMGPWVYSYSIDGGATFQEPVAYFPDDGVFVGNDTTQGCWFNSTAAQKLWSDDGGFYHFDLFWNADGSDNVTPCATLLGQWYSSEPSFEPVGISDGRHALNTFALSQNYPNPFNPTTNIEFTLSERSNVTLTVYNMLGQEVESLVNEALGAGPHTYTWDASNVASGVYFYKLATNDITKTKKMVLLK